ncbi:DUF2079 domain-containing protein [Candidatus Uhrbacteria bacterium]|nr:DUF2079 domain-containing protein [Candidatus Uhrbacteria bacterium]
MTKKTLSWAGKAGSSVLARPRTALLILIGMHAVFWSAVCLWKYGFFLYNGFDLAYFGQVFWNSLHGDLFAQTLHPHLSLGDHAELAIPLLLPLYAVWADPRMLLILQQAALAGAAWPIYLLAVRRFSASGATGKWLKAGPLILAASWLLCPSVQNLGLFEFHILPFALLPLFFLLLEYDRGRLKPFLFWTVLALLVREDVALAVFAVGILAWIEGKPKIWRWLPVVLAAAWFALSMLVISRFSLGGGYKFMVYYSWLGETPWQAAWGIVRHPVAVLRHVLTVFNFEMVLGFLMPMAFLPLLAPRFLVLAILPLLQIILGAPGGGALVVNTHYATLFLPAVFFGAAVGLVRLPGLLSRLAIFGSGQVNSVSGGLLALTVTYSALTLGPFLPAVAAAVRPDPLVAERAEIARRMLSRIPDDSPVAAGYGLMPALSSRPRLYALHYQFLGVTQFAEAPYSLPEDTRFLAVDTNDFVQYAVQFPVTGWSAPHFSGGFGRLRKAAGEQVFSLGDFQLFDREAGQYRPAVGLNGLGNGVSARFDGGLRLVGGRVGAARNLGDDFFTLEAVTAWTAEGAVGGGNPQVVLGLVNGEGETVWERKYPFGNGLVSAEDVSPVSRQPLPFRIRAPLPELLAGKYSVRLSVVRPKADTVTDRLGTVVLRYREPEGSESVVLGEVEVQ